MIVFSALSAVCFDVEYAGHNGLQHLRSLRFQTALAGQMVEEGWRSYHMERISHTRSSQDKSCSSDVSDKVIYYFTPLVERVIVCVSNCSGLFVD